METDEIKSSLAHVFWVGGAADAGKSTITKALANRYGFQVYNYDRFDLALHQRLMQVSDDYRTCLRKTMNELWVESEPADLFRGLLSAFEDRFPLVIEDLLALPKTRPIVAEGFGFLPALVLPLIASTYQAIWLVPSPDFKWRSMIRHCKLFFPDQVSDPERATQNLFERDMMLGEYVKEQAHSFGLTALEVNESRSFLAVLRLVERHFAPFLTEVERR